MVSKFRAAALAGAVALALGGTAIANTTLDAGATGDVFINVVDTTNNTSFLYDTGVSQASFNGSGSYSYTFTADPNYQAFVAAKGANDVLDYSVLSATKTGGIFSQSGQMLFTSNGSVSAQTGSNIGQAITGVSGFFTGANGTTSTTTNSAYLGSTTNWGLSNYEQITASNLGVIYTAPGSGVDALVGTALNFYSEASTNLTDTTTGTTTLATLAGKWTYANGVATYGASAVPLPTPLLLLLSGLGFMGVVARRGRDSGVTTA